MDAHTRAAILAAVDEGFPAQVDFTGRLVAQASFSGQEAAAQALMATELSSRGYEVDQWSFDAASLEHLPGYSPAVVSYEDTFNVVGTLNRQSTSGRSLILNGHVDVVPTGELDRWTSAPFEPRVADGKLYGRGSGDMKAGLVAALFALEAIKRAGLEPLGRIHLQSVVDEESSGNGTLACVARGYAADTALVIEPTAEDVFTAQMGILWFSVRIQGQPQHASGFQGRAANVIEKAFVLIQALQLLEQQCNEPARRHPAYASHAHPLRLNVGQIEGGNWPSSSPGSCTFAGRLGVYPGQDPEEVAQMISRCVAEASSRDDYLKDHPPVVEFKGNRFSGYVPDRAEDAKAILADAHRAASGLALREVAIPYGSDARVLGLTAGIPSLVYGPISENLHGIDEAVDLESLRRVTGAIALFVGEWCGIVPRKHGKDNE